ncbi:Tubulin-specific chaperone D [Theileria parva strain Muguga]|uniref:Tubulin folding chaperone, putative n=1 Tax=Theileria parva TaxID=5875 RepID=Q4N181_THEPA|nr:Tubulin-specific chaperone D [Theileria parva strain Muguga]EAN32222.1 Tubulin-specific chaperone D [Theileria parva strain Muguga]|eukprot:XP_764505.1 tubulin folding chaperone [Theileria parva strain Muguga]
MENVQNDVTYFTEHDEAKRMVEEISSLSIELLFDESKSGSASNDTKDNILEKLVSNVNKISDIVGKYMDIEVLLYQYIETLIGDIFEILKRFVLLPNALKFDITRRVDSKKSIPLITLEKLCFYLYIISKCVGVRRLINYAPNDVSLFEKITETIEMIQNTNSGTSETEISKHEDHLWCLEFIFLSWESLMVYTPFDLNTIWKHPFDEKITFQTRILTCSMYYLNKSTKARDGAAMVISNLFSRKDVLNSQDFQYFLKFCQDILTNPLYNVNLNQEYNKDYLAVTGSANNVNNHLSIGVLMVLKQIIKRVQTPDLIPYLDIFEFCLLNCDDIVVNAATKKLRSSCLGRLALHLLPPQEDSQKYRRKYRTIFTKKNSEEDKNGPQNTDLTDRKASAFDAARVEVMLSKILETLVDNDIRVRWACAKSVGRISSRLTIQMNEEILDHIIELINSQFTRTLNGTPADVLNINGNIISCLTSPKVVVQPLSAECESVVHGGCLAIAEILREGLIHPHMLNKVLDTTILTLSFEVWRGKGSAGTAVRDASCFICWAIARTFTKEMLSTDHVSRISMELVNVSLFDSSVNCRRAACSALQELVGRFGTVSKGLELIQICNYFTVSNRKKAFVEVCQQVARLGYYSNSMLQNVIRTKLFHPDMSTRELSSLAICKIVSATPHLSLSYINNYHTQSDNGDKLNNINDKQSIEFTVTSLIDYLLENLYTTSTSTTQGALRALARLLYFVIERNIPVNLILFKVLDVPVTFEKKRLFRNKSSNIIRQAICKLITVNCKLMLHMNTLPTYNYNENMETFKKIIDYYIVILKDSLRNFALEVQLSAVEAFEQLFMIIRDADVSENLLKFFTDSLSSRSDHISARRGYALVFSSIPLRVFTDIDEEKNRSKINNDNHTTHSEQKNSINEINTVNEVLTLLCNEIKTNVKYEEVKDSKTRQFALLSVLSILNRIKDHVLEKKILEQITETLVMCCNDYEIDSRGDVGSWVRELSSEVICYILNVYLFKNNNYRGNLSNTFKNMDKEMATNLTGGLVGLALENLEHVRSRSTFLMCHLFTNKLSKLNFKWIWNRIFYNIPYEQMISTNEDYCSRTRYVSATNSTSTPSTRLDDETEECDGDSDADRDVDYEIEKYIDRNYEIDMYINIDNRLLDGFNMLFDISKSLIQVISATYENKTEFNSEHELDYQKSLQKQKYSIESNGLIPVNDCENLLEYSLTNTEKLNVVLRIPGWSAAPLTFRTFLWVLLIPSYTRVAFKSIVKIIGENNRIEVNIHANNSVLVLEDVLIEFISQNKDTFISWAKSVKCFEMVLRDCSLELYNRAIATNDSKTSQKLVNSLKILFSHRLVEVQEWYELIEIMINDAKRTTNYAYLKSIVRCLEVLLMYESESFTKEILKTLLQLLVHQYPTIRSYVASHLTLALSSREDVLAEEAMEILDSCSFHVEDEDTILKSIKKLSTLLKV